MICDLCIQTILPWIEKGTLSTENLKEQGKKSEIIHNFIRHLKKKRVKIPKELEKLQKRVLIVDDEANMTNAIHRLLRLNGYKTEVATDGISAGILLEKFRPEVMTLDLNLPKMSGLEVIRILQQSPKNNSVKILVISAMNENEVVNAITAGADMAIKKPFDNNILVQTIDQLACNR